MKNKTIFLLLMLFPLLAHAQQPQSTLAPDYPVSASWVQGAAGGGYRPTAGTGLVLNIGPGTAFCAGQVVVEYAGGTLTMTAGQTNYVYLDNNASCVPTVFSAWNGNSIPIAIVVAGVSAITSIDDIRTMFSPGISSSSGGLTSPFSQFSGPGYSPSPLLQQTASLGTTGDGSSGFSLENVAGTIFAVPGSIVDGGADAQQGVFDSGTGFFWAVDSLAQEALIENFTSGDSWALEPGFSDVALMTSPGNPASGFDRIYFDSVTGNMTCLTSIGGSCAGINVLGTTFGDTTGSTLSPGSVVYMTSPSACTITSWAMAVDAGTATVDIWKIATGTAIPTIANTITASALPAISTGTAIFSTTLTGWTTSVSANDIFGFELNAVTSAKFVEIQIQCQ